MIKRNIDTKNVMAGIGSQAILYGRYCPYNKMIKKQNSNGNLGGLNRKK